MNRLQSERKGRGMGKRKEKRRKEIRREKRNRWRDGQDAVEIERRMAGSG